MSNTLSRYRFSLVIGFSLLCAYSTVAEQPQSPDKNEKAGRSVEMPAQSGAKSKNNNKIGSRSVQEAGDTSTLTIQVLSNENDACIRSAEVFLRSQAPNKVFERTLHTNGNGLVTLQKVPRGQVLIQVTATRHKSFGEYYDLKLENEKIIVRVEREDGQ